MNNGQLIRMPAEPRWDIRPNEAPPKRRSEKDSIPSFRYKKDALIARTAERRGALTARTAKTKVRL